VRILALSAARAEPRHLIAVKQIPHDDARSDAKVSIAIQTTLGDGEDASSTAESQGIFPAADGAVLAICPSSS